MERVEILNNVKELVLLPGTEMITANQVASFYNVSKSNIDWVVNENKEELVLDGYQVLRGSKLKELKGDIVKLCSLEDYGISKFSPYIALFPKRAILRVGMLLRDSEVAKEVRTQLLNIEEHASEEVKTFEIDNEQELHMKIGKAFADNDMMALVQATKELEAYKNRHIQEKADKWDAFLDDDGTVSLQFVDLWKIR
ncbi:hypothetical protein [Bacillus pseudomycoides]|uniref:hypothetical protein n=1 Tax=Bacillus pseudomycoides TaxID=64104 RepID=UPI0020D26D56|nr:hypothetical protein [Bacillus pseudomycoides]